MNSFLKIKTDTGGMGLSGTGEPAQQIRVLAAISEDQSPIPRTRVRCLLSTYVTPAAGGPEPSSGFCGCISSSVSSAPLSVCLPLSLPPPSLSVCLSIYPLIHPSIVFSTKELAQKLLLTQLIILLCDRCFVYTYYLLVLLPR